GPRSRVTVHLKIDGHTIVSADRTSSTSVRRRKSAGRAPASPDSRESALSHISRASKPSRASSVWSDFISRKLYLPFSLRLIILLVLAASLRSDVSSWVAHRRSRRSLPVIQLLRRGKPSRNILTPTATTPTR